MKLKIYLIFCCSLLWNSCEKDFLNQQPISELLSDEVFSDVTTISSLLSGVYEPMRWEFMQMGDAYAMAYIYTDVRSDDVVIENYFFQPHSHGFETFVDLTSSNINVGGIWTKLFAGVSRANEIIRGLANVDDSALDPVVKAQFLGEAQFLRAYYYFEIVKNFGDAPLFTEEPYDVTNIEQIQRKPTEMIYAQLEKDLQAAAEALPVAQDEKWKASKGAALGLLSKVYLYQEKWQAAADAAQSVIDLGVYELEENYADNFKLSNEFGKESLFEINYTDAALFGSFTRQAAGSLTAQFFSPNLTSPVLGWNYNLPTPELQAAFANEGDEIRRKATILMEGDEIDSDVLRAEGLSPIPNGFYENEGGINDPNSGDLRYGNGLAYSKKYFLTPEEVTEQTAGFQLSPLNHKVMRYAEVLLILAEAVANGASGDGQAAFDAVRARVNLPSKPLTLDAIKLERRLELATEWNRFHDLVRWGDAKDELDNFTTGRDELLPIPFNEIVLTGKDDTGSDILTQNPGY